MQGWVAAGERLDPAGKTRPGPDGCGATVGNLHWAKWELRWEGRGSGQRWAGSGQHRLPCGPGVPHLCPGPPRRCGCSGGSCAGCCDPAPGAAILRRGENLSRVFCWRMRGGAGKWGTVGTSRGKRGGLAVVTAFPFAQL